MAEKTEKTETTEVTMEKVNEAIETALQPIKELLTDSKSSSTDSDEKKENPQRSRIRDGYSSRRSLRDIEKQAEELVQAEVQKVFSEKEHEQEHKRLEQERSKKETQKPPTKRRWLTKAMLGSSFLEEKDS